MTQILIAEDEPRIAAFLAKGLKANGFTPTIVTEANETLNLVLDHHFDLLILDLGLPGKDGLEVLEDIRGQGQQLPIIILTARDEINEVIAGLEGGADDYMTKPFRFEELLARIRARLRNHSVVPYQDERLLKAGNVVLDLRTRKVSVGEVTITLAAREFTLAETFFRHPGQVLTREQLLDLVWGFDYDPGSNIVDVYVGYLRKKLGNNFIETVRGIGYRLGH
jgi:two-component system response regulator QseB